MFNEYEEVLLTALYRAGHVTDDFGNKIFNQESSYTKAFKFYTSDV